MPLIDECLVGRYIIFLVELCPVEYLYLYIYITLIQTFINVYEHFIVARVVDEFFKEPLSSNIRLCLKRKSLSSSLELNLLCLLSQSAYHITNYSE